MHKKYLMSLGFILIATISISQTPYYIGKYNLSSNGLLMGWDKFELFPDMTFSYYEFSDCTFERTLGIGKFKKTGDKITLTFDQHPASKTLKHKYRISKPKTTVQKDSFEVFLVLEDSLLSKMDTLTDSHFNIVFEGESYFQYIDKQEKLSKNNHYKFGKDLTLKKIAIITEFGMYSFYLMDSIKEDIHIVVEQFNHHSRDHFIAEGITTEYYIQGRWSPKFWLLDPVSSIKYYKKD